LYYTYNRPPCQTNLSDAFLVGFYKLPSLFSPLRRVAWVNVFNRFFAATPADPQGSFGINPQKRAVFLRFCGGAKRLTSSFLQFWKEIFLWNKIRIFLCIGTILAIQIGGRTRQKPLFPAVLGSKSRNEREYSFEFPGIYDFSIEFPVLIPGIFPDKGVG